VALSITEKLLLDGLRLFQLSKGNCILVMMLMDTDEKRWILMDYLTNTLNATENQIVDKAYRIAAK